MKPESPANTPGMIHPKTETKDLAMKRSLGLSLLALFMLQAATGCSSYSEDRDVYKSTYLMPTTVEAVYKPSKTQAWTYVIPPQHLLVVERDAGSGNLEFIRTEKSLPTKLTYELYPLDAKPSFWRKGHYRSSAIESGEIALNGTPLIMRATIGEPVDPTTLPTDRTIEEIEKDLPEPGSE